MQSSKLLLWPRIWLLFSGVHPLVIGCLLLFRNLFFNWLNMLLPSPALYGDIASAFLITIGIWLIWTAYKMPYATDLWIIPAGSSIGRIVYFTFSMIGYFNGQNELIYVLLGFSDLFFAIILLWIVKVMKSNMVSIKSK